MFDWFFDWCDKHFKDQESATIVEEVDEAPLLYTLLLEAIQDEIVEEHEMDEFIKDLDEGQTEAYLTLNTPSSNRFQICTLGAYTKELTDNCSGVSFKFNGFPWYYVRGVGLKGLTCEQSRRLVEISSKIYSQPHNFYMKLLKHRESFETQRLIQKLKDCQCKTH